MHCGMHSANSVDFCVASNNKIAGAGLGGDEIPFTIPPSTSSDRVRSYISGSRVAHTIAEEEVSASIDQKTTGAEEERRSFINGDVLDLFSYSRTSLAISKFYRIIRL